MQHSTRAKASRKQAKPYPDFELTPRHDGRWCKRIKGALHIFSGAWQEAKAEYDRIKEDLYAGRTPRPKVEGITIADVCNRFLTAKQQQRDAGELKPITWGGYKRTTDFLVDHFGKTRVVVDLRSEDFEALKVALAATHNPVTVGNDIQRIRVVFKYAFDAGLIESPVRYGPLFKRPSKKVLRLTRAAKGLKLYEAADIQRLLAKATARLKAMILLGANCGYGNHDCATLTIGAVDLAGGWCNHGRPKTGISRRCPLWPETVEALKIVLAKRRAPKDAAHAELVFVTKTRGSFAKDTTDSPITKEFAKLVTALGLTQKGRGFYSLRHTFRTVAGGARDLEATRYIMGHANEHVEDAYIERIEDARLLAVANHVRAWLYPQPAKKAKPAKVKKQKPEVQALRIVG